MTSTSIGCTPYVYGMRTPTRGLRVSSNGTVVCQFNFNVSLPSTMPDARRVLGVCDSRYLLEVREPYQISLHYGPHFSTGIRSTTSGGMVGDL